MGFWHTTCMISHLPIRYGDSCVGFLIADKGEHGNTSYPEEAYAPITPPIFGTYDDYGCLEIDIEDTPNTDKLVECLTNGYLYLDKDCDKEVGHVSLENILKRAVHSDSLYFKNPVTHKPEMVSLVLIHRSMYDFADINYRSCLDEVEKHQRLYCEAQKELDKLLDYRMSHTLTEEEIIKYKEDSLKWNEQLENSKEDIYRYLSFGHRTHYMLSKLITEGLDVAGIAILNNLMEDMRLQWSPVSGAGSQTSIEREVQLYFYEKLLEVAKDIYYLDGPERDYEEEDFEDEDEDL